MENFIEKDSFIYKYVPFSINTLKLLIKGEIWFGLPENLNDPFEGEFQIEEMETIPEKNALREFYEFYLSFSECEFEKRYQEIQEDNPLFYIDLKIYINIRQNKEFGVSCFSKRSDSILMWAYYADSHRGICLVFDRYKLKKSINKGYPNVKLCDVQYEPVLPVAKISQKGNDIHFDTDREVYLNKYIDWKKEEELRLINKFDHNISNRSIPFDKSCLKGIILGEKINKDNRNTLKILIENDTNYKIEWGDAKKNFQRMKMQIFKSEA